MAQQTEKPTNKQKKSKGIRFDDELITRDVAEKILVDSEDKKKEKSIYSNEGAATHEEVVVQNRLLKKRKRKGKNPEAEKPLTKSHKQKEKKKKKKDPEEPQEEIAEAEAEDTESTSIKPSEKTESIRARKRKKLAQLQEEKKMKAELACQEKSLNYLSKWKHSRNDWKFEKLKQIWLQNHMYDENQIPDSFWDTLIDYLRNCKGKAREQILQKALVIVEEGNDEKVKLIRARDVVQNLQE